MNEPLEKIFEKVWACTGRRRPPQPVQSRNLHGLFQAINGDRRCVLDHHHLPHRASSAPKTADGQVQQNGRVIASGLIAAEMAACGYERAGSGGLESAAGES
jgi:hypothetical protein